MNIYDLAELKAMLKDEPGHTLELSTIGNVDCVALYIDGAPVGDVWRNHSKYYVAVYDSAFVGGIYWDTPSGATPTEAMENLLHSLACRSHQPPLLEAEQ